MRAQTTKKPASNAAIFMRMAEKQNWLCSHDVPLEDYVCCLTAREVRRVIGDARDSIEMLLCCQLITIREARGQDFPQ